MTKSHFGYLMLICISWALIIVFACDPTAPKHSEEYLKKEALAKQYCSGCHQYVGPSQLDRISWPNVLKVMKHHMDISDLIIEKKDWIAIQQFYLDNSPKAFHSTVPERLPEPQILFEKFDTNFQSRLASKSTLAKVDKVTSRIVIGESNGHVQSISFDSAEPERILLKATPVDFFQSNGFRYILDIGSMMPSDEPLGKLIQIDSLENQTNLIDKLIRPVSVLQTDLDKDARSEFLICQFGSTKAAIPTGRLSLFTEQEEIIVDQIPGATMAKLYDIDKDGDEDIVCLFAQGNEMIKLYLNEGQLNFTPQLLIQFSPLYGSNSFDLADFNGDGHIDIVSTHGDNDDYSQVFKPYHGIRLHLNNGNFGFSESYRYHINGASKVIAADFDLDGDHDFVTLAMYPDYFNRPYEALMFFKNNGLSFKQNQSENQHIFDPLYFESIPQANNILLDCADIDRDGDTDILVAANKDIHMFLPPTLQKNWNINPQAFQIYKNKSIDIHN